MPQWGLDKEMRLSGPWDLPEYWLRPSKVVTDPIHRDIFLTKLEKELVDTPPFQRLRRVRQLGTTHWVYPSATHNRFAHSLGTLRAVQDLFDVAYVQRHGHHAVPDLFGQWEQELLDTDAEGRPGPDPFGTKRQAYAKRVAEAIVLARLGALLHDLCHVPFGHSLEDDLEVLVPHDQNGWRFDRLWADVMASVKKRVTREHFAELAPLMPKGKLYEQLRPLILTKEEFVRPGKKPQKVAATERVKFPFVADLVGNTICADLTDYLQRDHTFLGLPISLGDRFMSSFYVTPEHPSPISGDKGPLYQQRMAVLLHREGHVRADVVTELLKYLRYRYELQERALVHHAKVAADAMLGHLLELWRAAGAPGSETDGAAIYGDSARNVPRVRVTYTSPDDKTWENVRKEPQKEAARIEDLLLQSGDDGFLEYLARIARERARGVAELARDLLNRRLYKPLARAAGAHAAGDFADQFGDVKTRRALERQAAEYAGIKTDWHLILWIPPPTMRLKLAEMLVDHGQGIAKFVDYSPQGSDIYEAHRKLWTVSVYGHPNLTKTQKQLALVRLAELMGVCWDRYMSKLGSDPYEWPTRLAALEVFGATQITDEIERFLEDLEPAELQSRKGESIGHTGLRRRIRKIARDKGYLPKPGEK